ncbi:methylenetetrahydrofolate reductase C-terminal domain-containing protein [Candidatus Bipolaricaulota bacterium]|nr:methylenetetrahydrofolate reductase C-terminal domain-containing protein [Candidatus Bipolaricaulota bacterium]MBS3825192.1 methylenetetrahydrofolate reductase C-terminal domain-containing protein [Candidatus Bipolaricaulota bacterium]
MIYSEQKPWEEITSYLEEDEKVFVLGCGGCAAASGSGGEEQVAELSSKLEEEGWAVTGSRVIALLCNKSLDGIKLARDTGQLEEADSVLVACCGIGIQAVGKVVDKQVHPANDTISMGDFHGIWPSEETCERCGECLLEYTGGLCPLTVCIKGLLNGACGGSHEGECEVESGRPCGWELIYERLEDIGRLDLLATYNEPKARKKYEYEPDMERRNSLHWAIEAEEGDERG